jgi:hypothetical protein
MSTSLSEVAAPIGRAASSTEQPVAPARTIKATSHYFGENSPEGVAYRLFEEVVKSEQPKKPDRKWILDTYAECLQAVKKPNTRLPKNRGD